MKKIYILILFGFIFLLTSCNSDIITTQLDDFPSTHIPTSSETPTKHPTTTYEDTSMDSLNVFYIEFVIDHGDGSSTRYRIANIELYPTFDEMKNSNTGEFKYLKLISFEEYSLLANMYHFKDVISGEDISIVFYKNFYNFVPNNKYMIHVFPDNTNDFYWISDSDRGIFRLDNNTIICNPKFSNLYNLEVDDENEFINIFLNNK